MHVIEISESVDFFVKSFYNYAEQYFSSIYAIKINIRFERKSRKTKFNKNTSGIAAETLKNGPFFLVDFVFPIQIIWRYQGEYSLSKLGIKEL